MIYRDSRAFGLWLKVGMRTSAHFEVDGLWIGAFREDTRDACLERVRQALELIRANDPYRYRLVLKKVARIWVNLLPGLESTFFAKYGLCILDPRIVVAGTAEQVAATTIHEAMRARIERCGVAQDNYIRRQRLERACMHQGLKFAARLPDGSSLEAWIEARMAVPADFWADRSQRDRRTIGEIEMGRYGGLPDWLIRAVLALRRLGAWMR
jgi:hypothetical protein